MFAKTLKKKLMMQAAVLAAPLLLVGCSSVPDAVNPVEWYRSSVEFFDSEDADIANAPKENAEMSGEAAPVAEKKKITSGFASAQTPQREYAQPIMRQGDVVNPLGDAQKVAVAQPPVPTAAPITPVTTSQMAETKPMLKTPTKVATSAPSQSQPRDTRSVGEVYAANIAQTRPLNMNASMRGSDTLGMGSQDFGTVVVSSGGVTRHNSAYMQPTQVAALSSGSVQSDALDTYSTPMLGEPGVVTEGRAMSLTRFNSSMFTGSFQVATIQFGNGSAKLTGEDRRILKEVLNIHQQQGGVIRIVGHASSRTRNMAPEKHLKVNHGVSLGRSDMVARELLQMGMPGDRLFVGGVSDSQPLYQEVMPSGEAGNRRTEIFVDY